MAAGLQFYRESLGFKVEKAGVEDPNVSLSFGDARIMLETPADYYNEN